MWFEQLTGFTEESPEQVRSNLILDGAILKSRINGKEYNCGILETPSLAELRERVIASGESSGILSVREIVGDSQELHLDESNVDSLFQVASQFNLLEMVGPDVIPERGVGAYEFDKTQGPACAIAAGAGTVFRNYFAEVQGEIGQTAKRQIDTLAELGLALGNSESQLWEMRNGYALATDKGLEEINERLTMATESEIDDLRKLLRIGIQWNTQVTLGNATHTVTQAYCSALPVAYSGLPTSLWSEFAKLILEALYEATICVAILNMQKTGSNRVYLTLVGGGAFGNDIKWILSAIKRSLQLYKEFNLDVVIVSYGSSNRAVQSLLDGLIKN